MAQKYIIAAMLNMFTMKMVIKMEQKEAR